MTDVMPNSRPGMLDLEAKYRAEEGEFFFTGVQALVRLPFDQLRADRRNNLRTAAFVSGYQGSPLGGFDRELQAHAALLDQFTVVHKQGLNEELGATAVMGSQTSSTFDTARFDGVLGVWYGKAPGLDRAGDAIRHANFAGTSRFGGVLALTGDDPACKSSTLPSGSEYTLHDLFLPTIFPGNVQEILDFGLHAVALSRASGLWAAIKIVTAVADGAGSAEAHPARIRPVVPTIDFLGQPYVPQVRANMAVPYSNDIEREIFEARLPLARLYAQANPRLNEITVDPDGAWLGIASSGRTYYEVVEALAKLGLDEAALRRHGVRLLRMGMVNPLDPEIVRRFARGLEELVVVEEKRAFLEVWIKEALYGRADAPRVVGKFDPESKPLVNQHGVLGADNLIQPLARRLTQRIPADQLRLASAAPAPFRKAIELLPNRSPYFCSGCPHNTGTKVPDGATVGAGIGCHGMVGFMDPKRVGTIAGVSQMGGEGVAWIGAEPFVGTDHFIQNLGDGTFFHSGSLAIRQSIAAGAHITYKLLYNSAVAMTGGQDAAGARPVPDVAAMLLHEGVQRLIITTDDPDKYKGVHLHGGIEVWPRERIVEAQEELRKVAGVTVLIHDQQCAAEKRRDRKRGVVEEPAMRIVINERVCEGCGDCGLKSNCLSVQPVETEFGRKTQIHQSSCNKDYSCLNGDCPSFLTVVPTKAASKATRAEGGGRRRPAVDLAKLPEPTFIVPTDSFTVRMPGIGGTGVVTVSQVLGTAAMLDGKYVWGLDQTGLSQKAGPVVSDLRISTKPLEGTNHVTAGEVDLYLGLDLLVALNPANLEGASPQRTVAVSSTSKTPTGAMIIDTAVSYPPLDAMLADLGSVTRAEHNFAFDAAALTEGLFGETTTANLMVLGAAYQRGALPVAAGAIEQAIELNGAAVEVNKLAFRWGRMMVVDPAAVESHLVAGNAHLAEPSAEDLALIGDLDQGELGRLLRIRVPDLVLYQDRDYARRYVDTVRKVAAAEARAVPGQTALAETTARYLYKLMAYKDEYEVARLHLEAAAQAQVEAEVGGDVKVSYRLHPPTLRALGLKRKLELGSWFSPALASLAKGKKLRGTPADPFGYAKVRRVERALVKEYRELVEKAAARLDAANHATVVELAALPDMVRGYEHVKLANVERYRTELTRLRRQLAL